MPKIVMIPGERIAIEFATGPGEALRSIVLVEFKENEIHVESGTLDETGQRLICRQTALRLTPPDDEGEAEAEEEIGIEGFGEMLQAIFGEENVYVGDEHGIRPASKKKMT